jgi:feruloyl esterase
MRDIYAGPINPRNLQVIFPGPAKGSERQLGEFVDGKPFPAALDLFQFAALQDPKWDWTTLDWDKTVNAAVAKLGPLMHVNADLKPFFAIAPPMVGGMFTAPLLSLFVIPAAVSIKK